MAFFRPWTNLSLSAKIYLITGLMALLVALEVGAVWLAISTKSAISAFVAAEANWSDSQKEAVILMHRFADSRDEALYKSYLEIIQIPMGISTAMRELEKPQPSYDVVARGLLSGRIPISDVGPMISLIKNFRDTEYIQRAFVAWQGYDAANVSIVENVASIHRMVMESGGALDRRQLQAELDKVWEIVQQTSVMRDEFTSLLRDATATFEKFLFGLIVQMAVTVAVVGLTLVHFFNRDLGRSLRELFQVANTVGQGDFSREMLVRSENELGQLAEAMNRMIFNLRRLSNERSQAEEASHVKDLFLANISHEIRTPLAAIVGFADLLRDPSLSPQDREQYMEVIRHTSRNMTKIIDDLLDISKIEAGQIEITTTSFSLKELLSEIELMLTFRCRQKGLILRFIQKGRVPEIIKTDALRLKQILLNVIGNAIKFTDRGEVSVTYEVQNSELNVLVKDDGEGIPEGEQKKLFRPFSQGPSSLPKNEGAGLGLVVAQKLANLLGGDVQLLKSAPGQGSTFLVQIRTMKPDLPTSEASTGSSSVPDLTGRKILLVEDAPENQLLLKLYLSRNGAEVTIANDGREGVEKARETEFDIILMDMQMPIMDGYTATRALRRLGVGVPIIALTAHAMKEDRSKCLSAGCTDYMSKPVDRGALLRMVAKNL